MTFHCKMVPSELEFEPMRAHAISDGDSASLKVDAPPIAKEHVFRWDFSFNRTAPAVFAGVLFLSSMYCLLAYIPTTYFAFIQAPFQSWMPLFARLQPYLFAGAFCATAFAVRRNLGNAVTRGIVLEFWLIGVLGATYLMWERPLQHLLNNSLSFVWAIAFLLPVMCLGALDFLVCCRKLQDRASPPPISYLRVVFAALFVSLLYPLASALRFSIAGMGVMVNRTTLVAWTWAAMTQVLLFVFVFCFVDLSARLARRATAPERMRFIAYTALWWIGVAVSMTKVVLAAIPFEGVEAIIYSCSFSLALVLFVRGWVLRRKVWREGHSTLAPRQSKLDARAKGGVLFLVIVAAAITVPALIGPMDWNSVLEKIWAMALWGVAAALIVYRTHRQVLTPRAWTVALAAVISLLAMHSQRSWAHRLSASSPDLDSALRRHASFDASYAAASEIVTPANTVYCNEQCRFISNQTNIPADATVNLPNLDLVQNLQPIPGPRPNIFVIVVDSLRQDYLSPYNPAVSFTPSIADFAAESVVFRNAFTRYSGTTLSEPSIWSGMLQLHKHYVQPFHRINGLEKLIQVDGYQELVSVDTVLRVLLQPGPELTRLDEKADKWTDFDFCSTVPQAEEKIARRPDRDRPIFLYTQPQNIHFVTLSKTSTLRPPRRNYAPFVDYYASELERLDGCFGHFIRALKAQGLYENSIVVLTSDHGEALQKIGGERHAFSLKPEVIHIPLIVHVPSSIKQSWYYDPDLIAFNTDVAATLYELLGHGPVIARPEFGRPLFTPTRADMEKYRRESYLVASSYGPLYGLLSNNGRQLFIEHQEMDELFELDQDPEATHNLLTEETRQQSEAQVRSDLQAIADLYGYRYHSPTLLSWLLK